MTSDKLKEKLLKDAKIFVNSGNSYLSPDEGFIRINLGCTKATLKEALKRFKEAMK